MDASLLRRSSRSGCEGWKRPGVRFPQKVRRPCGRRDPLVPPIALGGGPWEGQPAGGGFYWTGETLRMVVVFEIPLTVPSVIA